MHLGVFERFPCEPDIAGTIFNQKDFDRCGIRPNHSHHFSTSFWQGEVEGRALFGFRLYPDPAAQPLQDFLANSQSDSGALELVSPVQSLEKDKNLFKVLRGYPQAIVAHGKDPFIPTVFRSRNVYARDCGAAVLDRVSDEVLKYLSQLCFVRPYGWQRVVRYNRTTLFDRDS